VTTRIRDTDKGLKALMKRMQAGGASVTVGVHEAEGSAPEGNDGTTVLDVALFNEFGTEDIPARSFIAGWSDENAAENRERLRKIGEAVVAGKLPSIEQGLDRFGLVSAAGAQARIVAGIEPENAPLTIARKGSSTPLVDTGVLKSAITHQVGGPK
jgi:hypothetical protein